MRERGNERDVTDQARFHYLTYVYVHKDLRSIPDRSGVG